MLTDSERKWLKCREKSYGHYCMWCDLWCDEHGSNTACPIRDRKEKFADAAEFEARVAARLAELFSASTEFAPTCFSCPCEEDCQSGKLNCEDAILKFARLQVEEEMDDRT